LESIFSDLLDLPLPHWLVKHNHKSDITLACTSHHSVTIADDGDGATGKAINDDGDCTAGDNGNINGNGAMGYDNNKDCGTMTDDNADNNCLHVRHAGQ
jgi:hypothetical protein